eukprot:GILK01010302.1.p1 GENE.GILK01010302.1~~GILK01010302.1.p1  ORF type:complete len:310 (-),score=63.23 GILK01010302.1:270-1166(-)
MATSFTLGGKWRDMELQILRLKDTVKDLETKLQEKENTLEQTIKQNATLREEIARVGNENWTLQQEKHCVEQQLVEKCDQLTNTTTKNEELQTRMKVLMRTADELQSHLEKTQIVVHKQEEDIYELQQELRRREAINMSTEEERDRLSAQLVQTQSDLATVSKHRDHKDKHIAILLKEKERLVSQMLTFKAAGKLPLREKNESKPLTSGMTLAKAPSPKLLDEAEQVESQLRTLLLENKRLKQGLSEETAQRNSLQQEIAGLKKENWETTTRLRNVLASNRKQSLDISKTSSVATFIR